ncbi:hypothetical protein [Echinicola sediminis]
MIPLTVNCFFRFAQKSYSESVEQRKGIDKQSRTFNSFFGGTGHY